MKFTRDQVLAAVEKIGRPCTTSEIGEAARLAVGEARYRDRAGSGDVSPALAELVAAGKLVTAKRPTRGRYGDPVPEPGVYDYLVPPSDRRERWYATPEQAATYRELLARTAALNILMDGLADELRNRWPTLVAVDPDTYWDLEPSIAIQLSLDQLNWLVTLITEHRPEV